MNLLFFNDKGVYKARTTLTVPRADEVFICNADALNQEAVALRIETVMYMPTEGMIKQLAEHLNIDPSECRFNGRLPDVLMTGHQIEINLWGVVCV